MILSAKVGTNKDLFPIVLSLYVPQGSVIADITYGKGVFWKNVTGDYEVLASDIQTGVDFGNLPHADRSIDCVVFDPPYLHGGSTLKKSINDCYRNENQSYESVIRLYLKGILESSRVLKKKGILILKTQDQTESGQQRFTHIDLMNLLQPIGYKILDLFVLVQSTTPTQRWEHQKSARKNHSYFIVAQFRK